MRGRPGWKLSLVVPCYNEAPNIRPLHSELTRVIVGLADDYEIIFVNDGSREATLAEIKAVRAGDPRVAYLSFSRNFGHEAASTAGLCHASGEAVVLMDADLQDPPEMLAEIVRYWRESYDVVAAQRREREGENAFKKAGSAALRGTSAVLGPIPSAGVHVDRFRAPFYCGLRWRSIDADTPLLCSPRKVIL